MKRLAQSLILLSASAGVVAEPIFHPAGENLTNGPIGNFQTLIGHTNNPATGSTSMMDQGGSFGFGLIPSFGVGLELGPVDNFTSQIDDLSKQMKDFETNQSLEAANQIKADFDKFLVEAGEKGYFQIHMGLHPIAPIVWNSKDIIGGSVVFDANVAVQAQLSILDSPIVYNPLAEGVDQLQTKTAVYIKAGFVAESSLGFSRPVFQTEFGTLHAGVRGKYYMAELRKTITSLMQFEDAQALLEEEAKLKVTGEQGFGIDLGTMWTSDFYRVGATFKNVNAPSFKYETIGKDCASKTGAEQDSCYIAKSFSDEIDADEKWVMDPQINVEFALHSHSRNWFVGVSSDISPVHDPVGNELQWFTASAGYATRSWIIPGFRVGYRKNLAGSQLSTANVGLSLFKMLHLDVAYGLESIKAEGLDVPVLGNSLPRSLQLNLGIDFLI